MSTAQGEDLELRAVGERAILVSKLDRAPAMLASQLREIEIGGVVDIVPAAATVLISCESAGSLTAVVEQLRSLPNLGAETLRRRVVEIPVCYDGDDLESVALGCQMTVDEVIGAHAGAEYHVDFMGFSPGFGYLSGLPTALVLPRRPSPRTRVPTGSVAIASRFSAVYPSPSPGGWHLIGRTEMVLFDPDHDPPTPLRPGDTVRFVPRS